VNPRQKQFPLSGDSLKSIFLSVLSIASQSICIIIISVGCKSTAPTTRDPSAGYPRSSAQQYYSGDQKPVDHIAFIACAPNLYFRGISGTLREVGPNSWQYENYHGSITNDVIEVTPGDYEFIIGTAGLYYPDVNYTPEGIFYTRTYEDFHDQLVFVTAQPGKVYYLVVQDFTHSGRIIPLDVSSSVIVNEKNHSVVRRK